MANFENKYKLKLSNDISTLFDLSTLIQDGYFTDNNYCVKPMSETFFNDSFFQIVTYLSITDEENFSSPDYPFNLGVDNESYAGLIQENKDIADMIGFNISPFFLNVSNQIIFKYYEEKEVIPSSDLYDLFLALQLHCLSPSHALNLIKFQESRFFSENKRYFYSKLVNIFNKYSSELNLVDKSRVFSNYFGYDNSKTNGFKEIVTFKEIKSKNKPYKLPTQRRIALMFHFIFELLSINISHRINDVNNKKNEREDEASKYEFANFINQFLYNEELIERKKSSNSIYKLLGTYPDFKNVSKTYLKADYEYLFKLFKTIHAKKISDIIDDKINLLD